MPRRTRAEGSPRHTGAFGASAGFTVIELLIGLLVGSIAMAMVFGMFVGTSAAIRDNNNRAMAIGEVEVALQRLAREIKLANSSNPDTLTGLPQLLANDLPFLPYSQLENPPYSAYTASSGAFTTPAPPAARLFLAQSGVTPLYQSRWCPNPDLPSIPSDASNSLVYYKVDTAGTVHRITLKPETSSGKTSLVRMDQSPISAGTTDDASPAPQKTVLVRNLKSVQFTYPTLLAEVNGAGAAAFDASLTAMNSAQRDTYLNTNFRKLIGIRLRVAVVSSAGGRPAISELRTNVQVRN